MKPEYTYFVSSPPHTQDLLEAELHELGFTSIFPGKGGVTARGDLQQGYRACLWSRIANRIYLRLHHATTHSQQELYQMAAEYPWEEHFSPDSLLSVSCSLYNSYLTNKDYTALVVKDGIVDRFRAAGLSRPNIATAGPDISIHLHLEENDTSLYIDLAGESLHKRGYRVKAVEASLKENVAAAMLLRAGWHGELTPERCLVDPMCGSGTLLIEAGLILTQTAPGLLRNSFGFLTWYNHDAILWNRLLEEAREKQRPCKKGMLFGFDRDPAAIKASRQNISEAGLDNFVLVRKRNIVDLDTASDIGTEKQGFVVINPPYGHRLGEKQHLVLLYQSIGRVLKRQFHGWSCSCLTSEKELAKAVGLRSGKSHSLNNGSIPCKLYHFSIDEDNFFNPLSAIRIQARAGGKNQSPPPDGDHRDMFANRVRKNYRQLKAWLKREGVTCYRIYDADIPEYAVAVDVYENRWIHLQEYQPPSVIDEEKRYSRLQDVVHTLPDTLGVPYENIYVKVRRRTRRGEQYEKLAKTDEFLQIQEFGHTFEVNLNDYLDTGLFLDARLVRKHIETLAQGKSFLNLFSYTCAATVYAAAGGAESTTSVDNSQTYLNWGKRNLQLNIQGEPTSLQDNHRFIHADCFEWLARNRERFDIIFAGPPVFSYTKKKNSAFDIERDHPGFINDVLQCLKPDGMLLFLSNKKNFTLESNELPEGYHIEDLSEETLSPDFSRSVSRHRFFCIKKLPAAS